MSTQAAVQLPITVAEYLEGEPLAECKHEFINGQVYAMSGASARHNLIGLGLAGLLANHLRGGPCQVFAFDLKVHIDDKEIECFYYPDVFVACDPQDNHNYYRDRPKVIVEIISPSTRRTDIGEKLAYYRRLPSVEEIMFIEQDWPELLLYHRADGWHKHVYTQLDSVIRLDSIGFAAPLAAFYAATPFPPDVKRPWYLEGRADG